MFLPDINFWVALSFDSHAHHLTAKTWFASLTGATCFFCRYTQRGFLRLANNPRAFPANAVWQPEAWRLYDVMMSDPLISFVQEPANVESFWRRHTQAQRFSHNMWNDAYLAAFAEAANLELVTFDQGFRQFNLPKCTILP